MRRKSNWPGRSLTAVIHFRTSLSAAKPATYAWPNIWRGPSPAVFSVKEAVRCQIQISLDRATDRRRRKTTLDGAVKSITAPDSLLLASLCESMKPLSIDIIKLELKVRQRWRGQSLACPAINDRRPAAFRRPAVNRGHTFAGIEHPIFTDTELGVERCFSAFIKT